MGKWPDVVMLQGSLGDFPLLWHDPWSRFGSFLTDGVSFTCKIFRKVCQESFLKRVVSKVFKRIWLPFGDSSDISSPVKKTNIRDSDNKKRYNTWPVHTGFRVHINSIESCPAWSCFRLRFVQGQTADLASCSASGWHREACLFQPPPVHLKCHKGMDASSHIFKQNSDDLAVWQRTA
jgi:hypothetical protein